VEFENLEGIHMLMYQLLELVRRI